jgi:hypothetical protein
MVQDAHVTLHHRLPWTKTSSSKEKNLWTKKLYLHLRSKWVKCYIWSTALCGVETWNLLTYLLTPHSTVLLQKLIGLQLVKKFPAFYGTRRFITAITIARHLSLFWASSIQSIPHIPPHEDPLYYYPPIYAWVSPVVSIPQVIIITGKPKQACRNVWIWSFVWGVQLVASEPQPTPGYYIPTKNLYTPLPSPIRATCLAHLNLLNFITRTIVGEKYRSLSSSYGRFIHSPVTSSLGTVHKLDQEYKTVWKCSAGERWRG